jgi:hypothetical protein
LGQPAKLREVGPSEAYWQLGHAPAGKSAYMYCSIRLTSLKVIHNELDYRLPISEGLAMFNVLQAREVPSKLVMFPDENHVSYS